MNLSTRHHFLPVFYLKRFTNENGFFYIYDVKVNEFKCKGKLFAPKTHFYEPYGNSIHFGKDESDFIEKSFSKTDMDVSKIIEKGCVVSHTPLNSEEWTMLQYFVNIMYWRLPANVNKVKEYISNAKSIAEFHFKFVDNINGTKFDKAKENELFETMKADPDFYKFFRLMLPAITYPEIFAKGFENSATVFSFPSGLPKLMSDNPIIYKNPDFVSLHHDDFIFPLTSNQLLIRHRFKQISVWSEVRILVDMLLLKQANEYVSCTDLTYPIMLNKTFDKTFNSIEHLRQTIFDKILETDNL